MTSSSPPVIRLDRCTRFAVAASCTGKSRVVKIVKLDHLADSQNFPISTRSNVAGCRMTDAGHGVPQVSSDLTLLRRLRAGQEDAATELYLRYAKRLHGLANKQTSATVARR